MPKTVIDLPYQVASLSILDAAGQLDKELEPDIPDDLLLRLHRTMLLGRRFDERMLNLQRQGRIGTFAPIKGQEAAQVPAVALLRASDWDVVMVFFGDGATSEKRWPKVVASSASASWVPCHPLTTQPSRGAKQVSTHSAWRLGPRLRGVS